jgi:photosynthetic reaction center cytochrome c subunit
MKLKILRSLVVILVCICAALVITSARAQKSASINNDLALDVANLELPAPSQTPAATAVPQEKTLGQTGKNIQVLKDLPESQLGTVMNFVAASLGKRCDYCHVNKGGNNWVWESDDKPEKQTAREMMKMVMGINKTTFKGNTEVSCYTCHRGRTSPMGIISLPVPTPSPRPRPPATATPAALGAPPATGQPAASPAPTPAMPTADQVLAKYTEAIGGPAAIDKMKTRVMKGTYTGFNGMALPFEVYQKAPDKFYINVTTQQGTIERAFDGKIAWEKSPRGINELTNPILDNLKSVFLFFLNIKLKEQFAQMRLGGKDKIGDRDVLIVAGRNTENRRERLFFDAETGLLLRRITYLETPIGVIPEQIDFEDYRDVDGVKLPFTVRVLSVEPGFVSTRKYDEIKISVPVEDTKFNMPPKP